MSALSTLRPVASFARFVGTALLITSAVRMVIVTLSADGASPSDPPSAAAAASGESSAGATAPPLAGEPEKPIRMRISVDVKPERADVYIDGVQRGRIPFVGDVSCVEGTPFVVEVKSSTGPAQRFERMCKPGTTRIQ